MSPSLMLLPFYMELLHQYVRRENFGTNAFCFIAGIFLISRLPHFPEETKEFLFTICHYPFKKIHIVCKTW